MTIARIMQIIGIVIVFEALYYGIAKDSMKMEVLLLFIGVMVFYAGRMFDRRKK